MGYQTNDRLVGIGDLARLGNFSVISCCDGQIARRDVRLGLADKVVYSLVPGMQRVIGRPGFVPRFGVGGAWWVSSRTVP